MDAALAALGDDLPALRTLRETLDRRIAVLEARAAKPPARRASSRKCALSVACAVEYCAADEAPAFGARDLITVAATCRALRETVAAATARLPDRLEAAAVLEAGGGASVASTFPRLRELEAEGLLPFGFEGLLRALPRFAKLELLSLDLSATAYERALWTASSALETADAAPADERGRLMLSLRRAARRATEPRVDGTIRRLADACGSGALPSLKALQLWHEGSTSSDAAWNRPGELRDYLGARLPPTAALWLVLELEDPDPARVARLLDGGADVHWRHPGVCTHHGLPATPLEYLCEGENFGWRLECDGWRQDCPEKWETWVGVAKLLLDRGASTEGFSRLARGRPFALPALDLAPLARVDEVEVEHCLDEVELSQPGESDAARDEHLLRLGATREDIQILRVSRGIPRTPSHERRAPHAPSEVEVVRALDGPVVRARVSPRRRLSAHLGALAARGAEATRAGVAGASRYVAPSTS